MSCQHYMSRGAKKGEQCLKKEFQDGFCKQHHPSEIRDVPVPVSFVFDDKLKVLVTRKNYLRLVPYGEFPPDVREFTIKEFQTIHYRLYKSKHNNVEWVLKHPIETECRHRVWIIMRAFDILNEFARETGHVTKMRYIENGNRVIDISTREACGPKVSSGIGKVPKNSKNKIVIQDIGTKFIWVQGVNENSDIFAGIPGEYLAHAHPNQPLKDGWIFPCTLKPQVQERLNKIH